MHKIVLPDESKEENCIKFILKKVKESGNGMDSRGAEQTLVPYHRENYNKVLDP
jgi:hypothetical protein